MNDLVKGAEEFPGSFWPYSTLCLFIKYTILFNGVILPHQENTDTHTDKCRHTHPANVLEAKYCNITGVKIDREMKGNALSWVKKVFYHLKAFIHT